MVFMAVVGRIAQLAFLPTGGGCVEKDLGQGEKHAR
jgi:hypothetical protein